MPSEGSDREQLAEHAARAWRDAESLLFVCLGNVCRSPFAERLARLGLQDARLVASAGHFPEPGRSAPRQARAAAARFGVDLASHRSQMLSRGLVAEAGAVFVFERQNHEAVLSCGPDAAERTHLLGALCPEGPLEIEDPFGGPASLYDAVYRQIAAAVEAAQQRATNDADRRDRSRSRLDP